MLTPKVVENEKQGEEEGAIRTRVRVRGEWGDERNRSRVDLFTFVDEAAWLTYFKKLP